MSKWEKAKSIYLSISLICMIAYVAIGVIAGVVYGIRYIGDKLQSRKAAKLIDDQLSDSVNGVDDDEVVERLKAAGWDYV